MMAGRIVASGGPELADRLEAVGYEGLARELGIDAMTIEAPADPVDEFSKETVSLADVVKDLERGAP